MNKYILIMICMFFYSIPSHAIYDGTERTSIALEYGNKATITLKKDLKDKVSAVKVKKVGQSLWKYADLINNQLTISGSGMYEVSFIQEKTAFIDKLLNRREVEKWRQSVYIPFSQPANAAELARQYLPVVIFNNEEEYFPQSLDSILSFNKPGEANSIKISRIHRVTRTDLGDRHLMGQNLKKYMEYNGHSDAYFNFGRHETVCELRGNNECLGSKALFLRYSTGSISDTTIYWDASIEQGHLYLSYYFFYAFDPKVNSKQKPHEGAHAFDRESFTIKFSITESGYQPQTIIYAGHLANQDLKFQGCGTNNAPEQCNTHAGKGNNILVEWSGGKTEIDWDNALKVGKHPVIYKAKGAHAIYPAIGHYGVDVKKVVELEEVLTELAGASSNSKLILPSFLDATVGNRLRLEKLDYTTLKYLAFSGAWVDLIDSSGAGGAKFPPFIRTPYSAWVATNRLPTDPKTNINDFDTCLNNALSPGNAGYDKCQLVKGYFDNIYGLNHYSSATVKVKDFATGHVIPNAQVRLRSSDGSFNSVETALSNGIHSFFFVPHSFIPDANVTYQLYAYTPAYGEIECGAPFTVNPGQLILNNKEIISCDMGAPVSDVAAPVITLNGNNPESVMQHGNYIDAGATAVDVVDGVVMVTVSGVVDTALLGSYTITYRASDVAGNVAIASRIVNVTTADAAAPVITLNGNNPESVMQHGSYIDAGATAVDVVDGVVMVTVSGVVDTALVGSYTIIYTATDLAGNVVTATRTVRVIRQPVFTERKLNDTGITWGGNYPRGNNSTCTGETINQQDCAFGRDAQANAGTLSKIGGGHAGFDFTKLDANGVALPNQSQDYAANPWSCVRDNHTGLVWEVKTPADSGDIHDANNKYRWGGKTAQLTNVFGLRYNDWDVLVDGSNTSNLCGFNDWRVPAQDELRSIVNYGISGWMIEPFYFPNNNSSSNSYWSSLASASNRDHAWSFVIATSNLSNRNGTHHVRLVRDGQDSTAPVITLNGNTPESIRQHSNYIDAGATAVDDVDGVVSVTISGTVDTAVLGNYTIAYTATDTVGNSVTISRIVNVAEQQGTIIRKLNDTGITWGGNYPSGNNPTCTGETINQQDCAFGRDAQANAGTLSKIGGGHAGFDFTKLDANGVALPNQSQDYATNPWSCVRDNRTGLIWEVKTLTEGIHNTNNKYRWGGKTAQLTNVFGLRYNDWDVLVDGSNTSNLCGFNDWRVPAQDELRSIVNYGISGWMIEPFYFPNNNSSSNSYWSSLASASNRDHAWSFVTATSNLSNRNGTHHVRLVRGIQ